MNHKNYKTMMSSFDEETKCYDIASSVRPLIKSFIRSHILKSMEDEIERLEVRCSEEDVCSDCLNNQITHLKEQMNLITNEK
jgi:hypothetical protein